MRVSLSELLWEVKGYWPYVPLKEKSMETGQTLHGVTTWIPAKVPGGVHYDLWKAGYIDNPYFGLNSLKCEWIENRWWMYRTTFPDRMQGVDLKTEKVTLIFEGLDYEAVVFFNDQLLAEHKGMYQPLSIDLKNKIQKENKLVVLFKGVPAEMGQIGYTSRTSTQKSRFNYKWDFSTRLVNIGFWRDVLLEVGEEVTLLDEFVSSDWIEGKGMISVSAQVQDHRDRRDQAKSLRYRVSVLNPREENTEDVQLLRGEESRTYKPARFIREGSVEEDRLECTVEIPEPELWYPAGSGRQPLYTVSLQILEGETILASGEWKQGIRSVVFVHNEREHEGALPYTVTVNGKKVYVKGVNLTPLDHIYGNVSREQYSYLVTAMCNAGVNLARIWGGGIIEKKEFYDLCDANGIMIWQEFIQSSSGIDNRPCEDGEFLDLLQKNAAAAVREKRNHTALIAYSGGNELMEQEDTPVSYENKNIRMLREVVRQYDSRRMFLPTSASGPREFITADKGVSHDVHGNWRYGGNPGHYVLYGESDNLFHSEFGMDGTCSVKSMKKFLPQEALFPTPMSGNRNWQHHGEWWGTYFRDCEMFGTIEKKPEELETFVRCSQYMQAEGLRFILEADMRRAYQNSGVIIWQLNEPWPNASCTNLVDYYGETKSAYYHVKRAFEELHVFLDYRSLNRAPGETAEYPVYVFQEGPEREISFKGVVRNQAGRTLHTWSQLIPVPGNGVTKVGKIPVPVPQDPGLYYVTLYVEEGELRISENTYVFSNLQEEWLAPLKRSLASVVLEEEEDRELADGRIQKRVLIRNTGSEIAVDAGVELTGDMYWLLGKENYIVLVPQESRWLEFLLIPKHAGGFEEIKEASVKARVFCI